MTKNRSPRILKTVAIAGELSLLEKAGRRVLARSTSRTVGSGSGASVAFLNDPSHASEDQPGLRTGNPIRWRDSASQHNVNFSEDCRFHQERVQIFARQHNFCQAWRIEAPEIWSGLSAYARTSGGLTNPPGVRYGIKPATAGAKPYYRTPEVSSAIRLT